MSPAGHLQDREISKAPDLKNGSGPWFENRRSKKGDVSRKKKSDPQKAREFLRKIAYFTDLEKHVPSLIANVSHVAEFVFVKAGDVLFREGDPAGNLFYVVKGEVSIYKRPGTGPGTPRGPDDVRDDDMDTVGCFCRFRKKPEESFQSYERLRTFEGYSTFSALSDLGNCVACLGPGKTFADEALKNSDPRNASVRCNKDCEFLIVHKTKFDLSLCEKVSFFKNIPGFIEYEANLDREVDPMNHPAGIFRLQNLTCGDIILKEGRFEDLAMFVIKKGTVEFRRTARMVLGLETGENDRCWRVIGERGVFCSASLLGGYVREPCSAVVNSDNCVMYTAIGNDLNELAKRDPYIFPRILAFIEYDMRRVLRLSEAFYPQPEPSPPNTPPPALYRADDDD